MDSGLGEESALRILKTGGGREERLKSVLCAVCCVLRGRKTVPSSGFRVPGSEFRVKPACGRRQEQRSPRRTRRKGKGGMNHQFTKATKKGPTNLVYLLFFVPLAPWCFALLVLPKYRVARLEYPPGIA